MLQFYGSADLGLMAYETADAQGRAYPGMLLEEGLILEILRPGTGDPLPQARGGRGGNHHL